MRKPALAFLFATSLACAGAGNASRSAAPSTEPARPDPTFTSQTGMLEAHYPRAFAAKTVGKGSILISRNLPDGHDEAVTLVPIDEPISDDLGEFARVVGDAAEGKLNDWHLQSTDEHATCNGQPGIRTEGTWTTESGVPYHRVSCAFLRGTHGYSFTWTVAADDDPTEAPILQGIVDGTVFLR